MSRQLTPIVRLDALSSDLVRKARKKLRVRAIDRWVCDDARQNLLLEPVPVAQQIRRQVPRVQRNADHAVGGRAVPSGVLDRVKEVPNLADAVLDARALVVVVVQVVEHDAARLGRKVDGRGRDPDDADGILGALFRRGDDGRGEELGEEEGPDVVGAQLKFVALCSFGPLGRGHHAGVVEQDMELAFFGQEGFHRSLDGGEVGEIEADEGQRACRFGVSLFYTLDGSIRFLLGSRGHINPGILGVEDGDELFANARVGPGNEHDLVAEI